MANDFIERWIVTGLIASEEFTRLIKPHWKSEYLEAPELQLIAGWCLDHFDRYGKVPDRDIHMIYMSRLQAEQVTEAQGNLIEQILAAVDGDFQDAGGAINAEYLYDETIKHFKRRDLELHSEKLADLNDSGRVDEAISLARSYKPATGKRHWQQASNVRVLPVRWHWKHVIPRDELTLIAGRKGLGKSHITISIAAIASSAGRYPCGTETRPRDVVIMSAEDSVERVIRPRLEAAGADLANVHIMEPAADTGQAAEWIEQLLDELPHEGRGAIVEIDPITAFMGSKDPNNVVHVRSALRPLSELAWKRNVSVIVIHHVRKGNDGEALDLVSNSGGFTHAARTVHLVLPDPNREGRNLLLFGANNLGPRHPGYAYQIVPETVRNSVDTSHIVWENEPVNKNADQILAELRKAKARPKTEEAKQWLAELLADSPVPTAKIKKAAEAAGMAWRTVEEAKSELGVEAKRDGGKNGQWVWTMPTLH